MPHLAKARSFPISNETRRAEESEGWREENQSGEETRSRSDFASVGEKIEGQSLSKQKIKKANGGRKVDEEEERWRGGGRRGKE